MEFTLETPVELVAKGYKDIGIFVNPSGALDDLIKEQSYTQLMVCKVDENGSIVNIFVK